MILIFPTALARMIARNGCGVLLPGDYAVQRGDTIDSVVTRAIKRQQDLLAEVWPTRQDGLPFKTPEEAINLAERPCQVVDLRRRSDLHRLKRPMPLSLFEVDAVL